MTDNKTPLVDQPSAAPSRKWLFGASGAAAMTALVPILYPALMAGLEAWSPEHAAMLGPVIVAVLTGLGFAVPAYAVRNRATPQQAIVEAVVQQAVQQAVARPEDAFRVGSEEWLAALRERINR